MASPQSKYRTLIAIIVLLLVTNIAMLVYFVLNKRHHERGDRDKSKPGFENVLQKEVGFNEQQVAQFKTLKETHWAAAKRQMEDMKQLKLSLFNLTKEQNTPDSTVNRLADSIAGLQKQIELNSFQHFKATRQICTPEQQSAYDSLMTKIITKMGRGGGKPAEKAKK